MLFLSLPLSIAVLLAMTEEQRYVAGPGLACVIVTTWLWMTLWDRDHRIPVFDVGMICAAVTLVYSVYPLMNYWAGGFRFGFLSDSRLHSHDPTPIEMGLFHLRHVLYLSAFAVSYAFFRGRGVVQTGNVNTPSRPIRHVLVFLFVYLTGYFVFLRMMTGMNYNTSYEAEAFAGNVAAFRGMPLIVLQVSGKLWGILFIAKAGVLLIVVSRCKRKQWLFILTVWIVAEIVQVLIVKGARTGLVMLLMATALLYHRLIRSLSMKFLVASAVSLLVFLNFLGLYRFYADLAAMHRKRVLSIKTPIQPPKPHRSCQTCASKTIGQNIGVRMTPLRDIPGGAHA